MGLSTEWMFNLSEEEIEKLAREDEEIVHKRTHFNGVIEKLKMAYEIAENARIKKWRLEDM